MFTPFKDIKPTSKAYIDVLLETRKQFPKFYYQYKDTSKLMKALNFLLKVISLGRNKNFMKFSTTIGYTIYLGAAFDSKSDESKIELIRHERVHMKQYAKYGFLFYFLYLFAYLPFFKAYYRTKFEQEAYEESMRVVHEFHGTRAFSDEHKEKMINRFTGPSYFWAWKNRKDIEQWYDRFVKSLNG